jgi:hypothetical protein
MLPFARRALLALAAAAALASSSPAVSAADAAASSAAAAAAAASRSPSPTPSASPAPTRPAALVPLTLAGGFYTLGLAVGTPPQTVRLALDSWSSDLWVATPRSLNASKVEHRFFDARLSSSFRARNASVRLPYPHAGGAGGGSVDVDVAEDIGDLEDAWAGAPSAAAAAAAASSSPAPSGGNPLARLGVVFGAASREDDFFLEEAAFDGMIGLAPDQGSKLDSRGVLGRLANETGAPFLFGLFLAPLAAAAANASGLAVGDWDARKFADPRALPVFAPVKGASPPSPRLLREGDVFDAWRFEVPHLEVKPQRKHASALGGFGGASAGAAAAATSGDAPDVPLALCGPSDAPGGCVAVLDIARDTIGLPPAMFAAVLAAVNASAHLRCAKTGGAGGALLLCPELFDVMPNLTFTVAGAQGASRDLSFFDLALGPADYCVPVSENAAARGALPPARTCRLLLSATSSSVPWRLRRSLGAGEGAAAAAAGAALASASASASPGAPAPPPAVLLLGAPFLRAIYTVYDARPGATRVGFAQASASAGVRPSSWAPPTPGGGGGSGGGGGAQAWLGLGSKEMWALLIGVGVGFILTGGLVVVLRDRCRERAGRRAAAALREELLFGLDDSGSIMIEERDLEDEEGFDDDESSGSALSGSASNGGAARAAAAEEREAMAEEEAAAAAEEAEARGGGGRWAPRLGVGKLASISS